MHFENVSYKKTYFVQLSVTSLFVYPSSAVVSITFSALTKPSVFEANLFRSENDHVTFLLKRDRGLNMCHLKSQNIFHSIIVFTSIERVITTLPLTHCNYSSLLKLIYIGLQVGVGGGGPCTVPQAKSYYVHFYTHPSHSQGLFMESICWGWGG